MHIWDLVCWSSFFEIGTRHADTQLGQHGFYQTIVHRCVGKARGETRTGVLLEWCVPGGRIARQVDVKCDRSFWGFQDTMFTPGGLKFSFIATRVNRLAAFYIYSFFNCLFSYLFLLRNRINLTIVFVSSSSFVFVETHVKCSFENSFCSRSECWLTESWV